MEKGPTRPVVIHNRASCPKIVAGDGTILREFLHPDRTDNFSGRYSLAHATVPVGQHSKRHRLQTSEVYFILNGEGRMHIDGWSSEVVAGDCFEIPPRAEQWIENIGTTPLEFLCIVDPAWQQADEIILEP